MRGRRVGRGLHRAVAVLFIALASCVICGDAVGVDMADYLDDAGTTYCWRVNASVTDTNVARDQIVIHGQGPACPLQVSIELPSDYAVNPDGAKAIPWRIVLRNATNVLFTANHTPFLLDTTTRKRVQIVHANLHACLASERCDPFAQHDENDYVFTPNQVGNLSSNGTAFDSTGLAFDKPGQRWIFAHVILAVDGSPRSRHEFATFATLNVTATTKPGVFDQPPGLIALCVVGLLLAILLVIFIAIWHRHRVQASVHHKPVHRTRNPPVTKHSSISMSELTASNMSHSQRSDRMGQHSLDQEDKFNPPLPRDDFYATAVLGAGATPAAAVCSPTRKRCVADFRHEIARWDVDPMASPITPSSNIILLDAYGRASSSTAISVTTPTHIDIDTSVMNTPTQDRFVPLESLAATPPSVRRHMQQFMHEPLRLYVHRRSSSGDGSVEQEVEL